MDPQRRPTSADVAALAGVSRATVSYVLNDTANQTIPAATRRRVLDAVATLHYTPHAGARALRGGSSRLVLVLDPDLPVARNLTGILTALDRAVAQAGRSLLQARPRDAVELATILTQVQPAVVVSLEEPDDEQRNVLERAGIPFVTGERSTVADGPDAAAVLQVATLAAAGHRRIGHVSTPEPELHRFADPRTAGVHRASLDLGLPAPRFAAPPAHSAEEIDDVLHTWTAGPDPVTAIACYNDVTAAACLAAARRLGLAVPQRLAVIGLDDELLAPFTDPPLTTIRLHVDEFAVALWQQASAVLEGHRAGRSPAVRLSVVRRGSV